MYVIYYDYGYEGFGQPRYLFSEPHLAIRWLRENTDFDSYPYSSIDYDAGEFRYMNSKTRTPCEGWVIKKIDLIS